MSPKPPVSAWWKAQELLARRAHGKQELINKLKLRDYPAAEIEETIKRLLGKGFLDDEAFAGSLTEELFSRRGYGFHAVLIRLRKKGLAAELSEKVVQKFFVEIDADEMSTVMLRLIMRRRAREKDKNKLFLWLQRRGFRSDEIRRVLEIYVAG